MNNEQFGQFWAQVKGPLRSKYDKITEGDLLEIDGNLVKFTSVVETRYGVPQRDEIRTWVDRRYSHWTGNYVGYQDPAPPSEAKNP